MAYGCRGRGALQMPSSPDGTAIGCGRRRKEDLMRYLTVTIAAVAIAMLGIVATIAYRQDWLTRDDVSDALDDVQAALPVD